MKEQDRISAIVRSNKYHRDFRHYKEQVGMADGKDESAGSGYYKTTALSPAGKWLCEKWALEFPINPSQKKSISTEGVTIVGADDIVSFLLQGYPISPLPHPNEWNWNTVACIRQRDKQFITSIDDNLVVLIDPQRTRDEILNAIWDLVKTARKEVKERKRGLQHNPWEVYDRVTECGGVAEAARRYYGFSTKDIPQDNALYKSLLTAYQKACRMIEEVEEK